MFLKKKLMNCFKNIKVYAQLSKIIQMETHRTNKEVLFKGIKLMAISLACMFLGPTLVYVSLTNQDRSLYILLLAIAIIICCLAMFFAFKGINTILDSMFKKK
ncbi:DUF6095 family protein [Tamlana sp. 2201CG12-4]|uniref:DUF6095 family protein n=1 Tax=Tamlana sp. 2201CG12-4 TaxID=3112582 RepID=UPI002DB8BB83|nr:DUF6095 family protein [Tamlana sp. 2201CG12-4]MEC3908516.1 DUF6095 family protein [Tamlana sp. 2201CG12-4]